jgi:hypothetical protein
MKYESVLQIDSQSCKGVRFTISRMSFGRRLELARRIREVAHKLEFIKGSNKPQDSIEAALVNGEVDRICLEWGLLSVDGLEIDGKPSEPVLVADAGPEELCREILAAIKRECGLSEEERKN